jgi:hypothetical protein
MKKLAILITALSTVVIVGSASAETTIIKHRGHDRHVAMMMHRDHGWHHHADKTVIIKHGDRHD